VDDDDKVSPGGKESWLQDVMIAKNKGKSSIVLFMFYRGNNSGIASNIAPLSVKLLQRK
jgi:hypothetical protein